MRKIHEGLWVGNAGDARNKLLITKQGIESVVDVAVEEPPAQLVRQMQYHRIPLADGAGNSRRRLQLAIQITHCLLITRTSCLVACSAGLSRSPVIAAAALCCWKTQRHRPNFDNPEAVPSDDFDSHPLRIQMNQILQEMANSHRLDINPAFLNDVIRVI